MNDEPIPTGQPQRTPDRLLVVDFDFFFPNPLQAGHHDRPEAALYDWGHDENLLFRELIWPIRAGVFTAHGIDLPRCVGVDGFWDRFTLHTDTLLVADSNTYAGALADLNTFAEVVLFDAHHDCGYRRTFDDYLTDGRYTCEDWTFPHHKAGTPITVNYPAWRDDWPRLETTTAIPVRRHTDPGGPIHGAFTTVFACRSGCWVPPWCDDQWQRLCDTFPGHVINIDRHLRPRWTPTQLAEAEATAASVRAAMAAKAPGR